MYSSPVAIATSDAAVRSVVGVSICLMVIMCCYIQRDFGFGGAGGFLGEEERGDRD